MDAKEFRDAAHKMVEFVISYNGAIRDKRPLAAVKPGYLRPLLPDEAPSTPDSFDDIMKDVHRYILPGVNHFTSPQFHAYLPTGSSYPSLLGELLCGTLSCVGFSWISSPVCTELEVIMMEWLAKLLGLPEYFLASTTNSHGGGIIQGTASETTLVAILAARQRTLKNLQGGEIVDMHQHHDKLIAYASEQSNSNIEKAVEMASVRLRRLPVGADFGITGDTLKRAIEQDIAEGLTPFIVVATLGTMPTCAFDHLDEISAVLQPHQNVWLHVDAAYAGAAYVCPEYRSTLKGIERADSFNFNPHQWLLVNFDCSAMWLKDSRDVVNAFNVNPVYLQTQNKINKDAPDYRHWQLHLSRRFRSLKLWFVLKLYGQHGLQSHIRKQIGLAKQFELLVDADLRFEIIAPVKMGLVCFRLHGPKHADDLNSLNARLIKLINAEGAIHLEAPSKYGDSVFLRMAVCSRFTEASDMIISWKEIQRCADKLLEQNGNQLHNKDIHVVTVKN